MLCNAYTCFRFLQRRGVIAACALVLSTITLGFIGFQQEQQDQDVSGALYRAICLLAVNGDSGKKVNSGFLEAARWLGLVVWASTVIAVILRLFREAFLRLLVRLLASRHVIVAGLGRNGDELVIRLRARGLQVVVIEPNPNYPGIVPCAAANAIVLIGDPADAIQLERAKLQSASRLLVLFDDDSKTMDVVTTAFKMLQQPASVFGITDVVRCIAKLTEPSLQEVINRHELNTESNDRFLIETLNPHELTARSMLSEATQTRSGAPPNKLLVLGLGEKHRIAETLILRAANDWFIDHGPNPAERVEVHVYDNEAAQFTRQLCACFPCLEKACLVVGHKCSGEKCGMGIGQADLGIEEKQFDAAFVCLDDEARALVQSARLRRFLADNVPIVVLVEDSRLGFGALLNRPNAGGLGPNIYPVGLQDRLLDVDTVLNPGQELLAQACHEGYLLALKQQLEEMVRHGDRAAAEKLRSKEANVPWSRLTETHRAANRALVGRYRTHLALIHPEKKPTKYKVASRLSSYVLGGPAELFEFSNNEVEFLSEREHEAWMQERIADGWRYGSVRDDARKIHDCLVPYAKLPKTIQQYDKAIIAHSPTILAKGNFVILPDEATRG